MRGMTRRCEDFCTGDAALPRPRAGSPAGRVSTRSRRSRGPRAIRRWRGCSRASPWPRSCSRRGRLRPRVSFYNGRRDLYPAGRDRQDPAGRALARDGCGRCGDGSRRRGLAERAFAEGRRRWPVRARCRACSKAGWRRKESREQFVETGKQVAADWVRARHGRGARRQALRGRRVCSTDAQVFVPAHGVDDLNGAAGVFAHKPRKITFDRAALSSSSVTDDEPQRLGHRLPRGEPRRAVPQDGAVAGHQGP